jgi:hypothetical protein
MKQSTMGAENSISALNVIKFSLRRKELFGSLVFAGVIKYNENNIL